jgi:hypothetical protein
MKIIDQCDVKYIMSLLMNRSEKISKNICTARPNGLESIQALMSVSIFTTAIILHVCAFVNKFVLIIDIVYVFSLF